MISQDDLWAAARINMIKEWKGVAAAESEYTNEEMSWANALYMSLVDEPESELAYTGICECVLDDLGI